jgi:hypothetical protein
MTVDTVKIFHRYTDELYSKDIKPSIGFVSVAGRGMWGNPSIFHEILCRQSFERRTAKRTGIRAQRALFNAGTLDNSKVVVQIRKCHGVPLRELVAGIRFEQGDDVTLYGGFLEVAVKETNEHTHTRHIPGEHHVLNGQDFANCFPTGAGGLYNLGLHESLTPRCVSKDWECVIRTTGVGYMANTVTRCPLYRRLRPNVVVSELPLGRTIPGIPYSSLLVLQAGSGGIDVGDPIISTYEQYQLKEKFQFKCSDPSHYLAAGRAMPTEKK